MLLYSIKNFNFRWSFESDCIDVFVIHTFVAHPDFLKFGVGKKLIDFSVNYAKDLK
ncbi:GNAT family N-acetyltransferase [Clostridioides difficile]